MTATPPAPVLRLVDAAFGYDGRIAVSGLRFALLPGHATAIIGPNGSGKSTLLGGILGLTTRLHGRLEVPGERSSIGYLSQSDRLDPQFPVTLAQVVGMGRYRSLGFLRWPGRADRQAVADALDTVGLTAHARRRFGTLSGGQQQRGLLARAIASQPRLLLLDEPFNGLDQVNRNALVETLRRLKGRGVAILVSTHDLDLARAVCDDVLLVNGTQVAYGPTDEVLTLPNVQATFHDVQVEVDEHTLVMPDHSGHR